MRIKASRSKLANVLLAKNFANGGSDRSNGKQ